MKKYYVLLIISIVTIIFLTLTDYSGFIKKGRMDTIADVTYIEKNNYHNISSPTYYYLINDNEYACYSNSHGFLKKDKNPKVYYESFDPINCVTSFDLVLSWYDYVVIILAFSLFFISLINLILKYKNKR